MTCGVGLMEIYAEMRSRIASLGSQQAFAANAGVSAAYVSDVLNARRDPGAAILKALGYRKVVVYQMVAAKDAAA